MNPWRAVKSYWEGARVHVPTKRPTPSPRFDEMYAAVTLAVSLLRASSPFPEDDADVALMPFSHKIVLFHMLLQACWNPTAGLAASVSATSLGNFRFTAGRPTYSTFKKVLGHPDFKNTLRFHRCVKIGRCPKCSLYRYKLATAPTDAERVRWRALMTHHQLLQLGQKRAYVVSRAISATDFPDTDLYLGFDGGSGYEFWLPHLAPAAAEGVSKAADQAHTPGFKVMNGIVHGAPYSHVILSPWSIVAGSNHVCECLAVAINTCILEYGRLPPSVTLQGDNSSVNHSNCVLAFLAVYVLFGCFKSARLRFMLEHHAHDVYDAFHGVTKRAVERHTYYFMEELIAIIKGAHALAGEKVSSAARAGSTASAASAAAAPEAPGRGVSGWGHDVRVANLFEIRDVWEWLYPGRDLARGACAYFEPIAPYHDFELRRDTRERGNVKVELWAKEFMTSQTYSYVGTMTSWKLYKAVAQTQLPKLAPDTQTVAKEQSRAKGLKELTRLQTGPYREQFTRERLADAKAICEKRWGGVRGVRGGMPAGRPAADDAARARGVHGQARVA